MYQRYMKKIKDIIKKTPLYKIFCYIRTQNALRQWKKNKKTLTLEDSTKTLETWKQSGQPVPPPHIVKVMTVKEYGKKFDISIFIETGTFQGEMIQAVKKSFPSIHSVELSKPLYNEAKKMFASLSHIHLWNGDSAQVLSIILESVNQPALFWLDAHYSGGVTQRGSVDTPITEEMATIARHPIKEHVILIDDAREFNGKNNYPTLDDFTNNVKKMFSRHTLVVKDDIIRITPDF